MRANGKTAKAGRARVYRGTARNLARLAGVLREGGIVAVPTETVYGLAGDALNAAACRKIFKAKGRPANDPLIVHIWELAQLNVLAERNEAVDKVAGAFWPGPLTIVLPKKAVVPDLVTSGRPSVAVRMPRHRMFLELLKRCGRPLAAPSANPFGYISPTTAAHVRESLGGKIDFILDGGDAEVGLESTILDLRDPKNPAVLRPGAISVGEIAKVLGRRVGVVKKIADLEAAGSSGAKVGSGGGEIAPGMLSKHYSPKTAITLHRKLSTAVVKALRADEAAVFLFKPAGGEGKPGTRAGAKAKNVFWLSERGDLRRAARGLFGMLRALDGGQWKLIHAELAPGTPDGFAAAINDRLTRAAAKR
ncbi:threonylcarbamoyl-AMP synthase [Nibricoccus aquaticus]|uniref:Threonylcarbamoyl-AMP synthase n=2 Tax=Nibricoccus aquaticus TaxID=2576891 RepID=A0A290QBM0_9BACT|nr:threonylcarbamoyl-AMP synthase [Nibricoccus aquaticus]